MHKNNKAVLKGFLHKCPEEKKQKFASSNVALLVSVGQPYHEGEKLEATINFINKRFRECNIMVGDTLQRHTVAVSHNMDLEKAYKKTIEDGVHWVDRNLKYINLLQIPYKIYHWDYWLNQSEYDAAQNRMSNIFEQDSLFRQNIDISIKEFLNRNPHFIEKHGHQKVYDSCLKYLLEETCIIMDLWRSLEYNFLLYPGKIVDILKYVHYILNNGDFLYWVQLKFRRNK